jgi:hypothetical protein
MASLGISRKKPNACNKSNAAIITSKMPVVYRKIVTARLGDRPTSVTPVVSKGIRTVNQLLIKTVAAPILTWDLHQGV